jgi:hypothetical protein
MNHPLDAFAELGLPRSTVVDEQEMARRFDELSRARHPDAGGDPSSFARLAEARRLLSSTALRWRHLLELEHPGTRLDGALPPALMDVFASLGPALQAAQDLERRKAAASSALARALLAPEEMRQRESLESTAATLAAQLDAVIESARSWDGTAVPLAAWAREAAFLEKWQSQVRDVLGRLGL